MPSTTNHAPLEAGTESVSQAQETSERILSTLDNVERALDEKIKRDTLAKNTPDPKLSAEIEELKAEIKRLGSENSELRQAVDSAGAKLDVAIESLSSRLSA